MSEYDGDNWTPRRIRSPEGDWYDVEVLQSEIVALWKFVRAARSVAELPKTPAGYPSQWSEFDVIKAFHDANDALCQYEEKS